MKKFELYSSSFIYDGKKTSASSIVRADSYDDIIQEIESNAGWYTGDNGAFKVAYIEEVVE